MVSYILFRGKLLRWLKKAGHLEWFSGKAGPLMIRNGLANHWQRFWLKFLINKPTVVVFSCSLYRSIGINQLLFFTTSFEGTTRFCPSQTDLLHPLTNWLTPLTHKLIYLTRFTSCRFPEHGLTLMGRSAFSSAHAYWDYIRFSLLF